MIAVVTILVIGLVIYYVYYAKSATETFMMPGATMRHQVVSFGGAEAMVSTGGTDNDVYCNGLDPTNNSNVSAFKWATDEAAGKDQESMTNRLNDNSLSKTLQGM